MSKALAASNQLMKNYLSELLTDEENISADQPLNSQVDNKTESSAQRLAVKNKVQANDDLEKLFRQATLTELANEASAQQQTVAKKAKTIVEPEQIAKQEKIVKKSIENRVKSAKDKIKNEALQVIFFQVAGLTFAVPLIELGGIHQLKNVNDLVGQAPWLHGIMSYNDKQIQVVDTAQWMMPEKCDQQLTQSLKYRYVIMLENSNWGISAEQLVATETLQASDVKWLPSSEKRPWLAGLVKQRMCVLLNVPALIRQLNEK